MENRSSGQALVEFALVLMFVILPFTFVLVDGALLLFHLANITNDVREGARAGSIWRCKAPDCTIDYTASIWDQYPPIDAARLRFIKDEMSQHYNPLEDFNACATTVTYDPDPPFRYAMTCTENEDGVTTCSLDYDENGNPIPLWNITRGLYSLKVNLACPHHLLFGLVSTNVITLSGEAKMTIEPSGY
jgi:hypothetical protein